AQCGGGFRRDGRDRRGRLRVAWLRTPRPERAERRGAPRLRGWTRGGIATNEGQAGAPPMSMLTRLRRRLPDALLLPAVTIPWLALLALGTLWLWQHGRMWAWAIVAAALALLAWPLTRLVRRRHNAEMRTALGDRAEPSRAWNTREREAWSAVL